jgi:beta-glucanase (GH16 family)
MKAGPHKHTWDHMMRAMNPKTEVEPAGMPALRSTSVFRMKAVRCARVLAGLLGGMVALSDSGADVLLYDDFSGPVVDSSRWFIPTWTGPSDGTFIGRTQFRCAQNSPLPSCNAGSAAISVETYNPTGFFFYGTDLISARSFSVGQGLDITIRARMNTATPGIVAGLFLYALKPGSSTLHDEIDFELLTNTNQPQTNIYADEPLGVGHPQFVSYASGAATDYHTYAIRWLPNQVSWFIDGALVRTSTNNVPTGPMRLHLNAWVPDSGWPQAYSAALQPTAWPGSNQMFSMSVDSVLVQTITAPAQMLSPANGSTNGGASVSFTWSSGTNVTAYALWVGSAPGAHDMHALALGTNLSQTLVLPAVDGLVYVRLWSLIDGTWQGADYSYMTPAPVKAAMVSPAVGSTNTSASMTLQWNSGVGVSQYALWVGSASNAYDLAALPLGTHLSHTLSMPVDGRTLWVRLWSLINGRWQYNDCAYRAFTAVRARFANPSNGATLGGTNVTLSWDAGVGVSQYALWVGSAPGAHDLYAQLEGTNLSRQLSLPSNGSRLYVKLWSLINGSWVGNNYEFTSYTASAPAAMLNPAPGATNSSGTVIYNWSRGTNVTAYALWFGSELGTYGLGAFMEGTTLTATVNGLPVDGSPLYVRLWSLMDGNWQSNDYFYQNSATGGTPKAVMTSPAMGSVLGGNSATFHWTAGTNAAGYAIWAGSAPGAYDVAAVPLGTNLTATVTGLPVDGRRLFVRLWSLVGGQWQHNDYVYMAATATALAQMTSPANGTTNSSGTVTLNWSAGVGVNQYAIWVGSLPGGCDLSAVSLGTNLTTTLNGLPEDGGPIYVRLWSLVSGVWKYVDYFYMACLSL